MAQTFSIGEKVVINLSSIKQYLSKDWYDRWHNKHGVIHSILTPYKGLGYRVTVGSYRINIHHDYVSLVNEQLMLFDLE